VEASSSVAPASAPFVVVVVLSVVLSVEVDGVERLSSASLALFAASLLLEDASLLLEDASLLLESLIESGCCIL
jgi:hypothetical protein